MGQREDSLNFYLTETFGYNKFLKPKKDDFYESIYNDEITYIFSRLNGILDNYPTNYRGFDIQCNDFIIELDEERHFNRYRLLTLKSQYYKVRPDKVRVGVH